MDLFLSCINHNRKRIMPERALHMGPEVNEYISLVNEMSEQLIDP